MLSTLRPIGRCVFTPYKMLAILSISTRNLTMQELSPCICMLVRFKMTKPESFTTLLFKGGVKGAPKTAKPHRSKPKNRKHHLIFSRIPKPHCYETQVLRILLHVNRRRNFNTSSCKSKYPRVNILQQAWLISSAQFKRFRFS